MHNGANSAFDRLVRDVYIRVMGCLERQSPVAVRDRFASNHFMYLRPRRVSPFASEIKQLLGLPGIGRRLQPRAHL